ncbi:MAG: helix-turn-helix domain-containing protein [Candidatus Accumulibacter sp.]|jgi:DNA-binding XRE family transcriptional regulator|nr:helix-turn-helix domain-containing protein [Accumulibacter sp.]
MNTLTDSVQILRDAAGHPAFAVLPFAHYQALVKDKARAEPGIPAAVVDLALDNDWSAARAWREHLELTQAGVAERMGITQGAYAQLEAKKTIRKSSREKIARALDLHEAQLDF